MKIVELQRLEWHAGEESSVKLSGESDARARSPHEPCGGDKESTTSGVSLPSYWTDLISLIDVAADASSGATVEDCDDDDEEADGPQAQITAQSREQKEQRKQKLSWVAARNDGE